MTLLNSKFYFYFLMNTHFSYRILRDIEASITCAAVANRGRAGFDFIMGKYVATPITNPAKVRYLNALACSQESVILQE